MILVLLGRKSENCCFFLCLCLSDYGTQSIFEASAEFHFRDRLSEVLFSQWRKVKNIKVNARTHYVLDFSRNSPLFKETCIITLGQSVSTWS